MRALAAAALFLATPAAAEVKQASATGFTLEYFVEVAAPPAKVRATLLQPSRWWDPAHTYSGSAANLTLDPRPGGCWCEKMGDGGVEHMRVVYIDRTLLRLHGGLGPLQGLPVTGVMEFQLLPTTTGTRLSIIYLVAGSGIADHARGFDGVLAAQWARLKAAAER